MLKLLTALIVAVLTPQPAVVSVPLAQKVLAQSVLIRVKIPRILEDGQLKYGMAGCSGTYIAQGTVLTAAHCFRDGFTEIWIRGYGNKVSRSNLD